jgi:hypothetical protein
MNVMQPIPRLIMQAITLFEVILQQGSPDSDSDSDSELTLYICLLPLAASSLDGQGISSEGAMPTHSRRRRDNIILILFTVRHRQRDLM